MGWAALGWKWENCPLPSTLGLLLFVKRRDDRASHAALIRRQGLRWWWRSAPISPRSSERKRCRLDELDLPQRAQGGRRPRRVTYPGAALDQPSSALRPASLIMMRATSIVVRSEAAIISRRAVARPSSTRPAIMSLSNS